MVRTTQRLLGIGLVVAAALAVLIWRVQREASEASEEVAADGAVSTGSGASGGSAAGGGSAGTGRALAPPTGERIERFANRRGLFLYMRKSERTFLLLRDGRVAGRFPCALGRNTDDKVKEGDLATPEGEFYVCRRIERDGERRLRLSYPNAEDAARGLRTRLITRAQHARIVQTIRDRGEPLQRTKLGGYIAIYAARGGLPPSTRGGIALASREFGEVWRATRVGTPVLIEP